MKKSIIGIFAAGFMLLAFSTTSIAQKKETRDVKAVVVEANRGANPNIKSQAPTTDTEESKSRGTCSIYFSNYTGFYINIYVDGYYRGQLSPWGGGTVNVGDGYTSIYCITAGQTREWSDAGNCSGSFTFRLYP